jgi:hypothetical protein
MHQIKSIPIPDQPAWRIDGAEDLRFIGTAIPIEIPKAYYPSPTRIAPQRSISIAADV